MDIYEVSEDTMAIVSSVNDLGDNISASLMVIVALVGMILGYLAMTELLRIWTD